MAYCTCVGTISLLSRPYLHLLTIKTLGHSTQCFLITQQQLLEKYFFVLTSIVIFLMHFRNGRPALTFLPDVLSLIFANETMLGRCVALPMLDSRGGADVVCHVVLSSVGKY